ncbi:MAG TPA: hypothetical protein VM821_07020 [Abditibacteriaceae bacterium]|nr:hypothetical protein [Abditibacteriaceae bacterium]
MAKKTTLVKKPSKRDIAPNALMDFVLPENPCGSQSPSVQTPREQLTVASTDGGELLLGVERRKGERRQNEQRRSGVRGHWEERRILDRRQREYSMFGKPMSEAAEELLPNPPDSPDVPLEVIISRSELRILAEQEQLERERKAQRKAARKTASKTDKRRKKASE